MASHLPAMYSSTHLWESTWFRLMRSYIAHKPYTYRVVHDQLMLLANTNTQLSDIMLSLRIERHVTRESFYIC
ncbi:unnamed protein product [Brassica rapa]|uniref:Uncharacterized protein n=3 Tax=Brassica TaxID=3705 RepID=A0A8D9GJN1_BRACM|nr:unnamed protein product [Brassica napus]CAG7881706.1 unnamed protein product [Brassica rapa]